jgi:hypothetical protein
VKPVALEELVMLLKQFGECCVYLDLVKEGLWVIHDRILFEGPFFGGSCSIITFIAWKAFVPTI